MSSLNLIKASQVLSMMTPETLALFIRDFDLISEPSFADKVAGEAATQALLNNVGASEAIAMLSELNVYAENPTILAGLGL